MFLIIIHQVAGHFYFFVTQGLFAKADVLELGAGCGVMGVSAALHSSPPLASLTQTDIFPHTLRNLQKTQELNGLHEPAEAQSVQAAERQTQLGARVISLNWADSATWPRRAAAGEVRQWASPASCR